MSITKEFVAAGKAIFTVELPESFQQTVPEAKPHYTYKVTKKDASLQYPEAYFVLLLSGPDNTSDYAYVGMLDKFSGSIRLTGKSRLSDNSMPVRIVRRVLERLWKDEGSIIEQFGWKLHHEGRCCRCGRKLTVPSSVESGIGPECAGKMS
jgi:uncharacterized protein DUF6011